MFNLDDIEQLSLQKYFLSTLGVIGGRWTKYENSVMSVTTM